ncbi:MAG: PhoH family protein, partial [Deltaproteobacteria bacterium]|nr:PhoH family protein [Deltaproteobacteria bacterium]
MRVMTTKNFILDTNVLLHDPEAIYRFEENTVCIPIVVIEEVDTFKKDPTELGRNAREIARRIDAMRTNGSLTEGVPLPDAGLLRVVVSDRDLPRGHRISHQADNLIMATALHIKESEPDRPAIFVSLDTNLRIRANALGIEAVDYDTERISIDELYPGTGEVEVESGVIDTLFDEGTVALPPPVGGGRWYENEYLTVRDGRRTALARVRAAMGTLELTYGLKDPIWGIRPRNREQHYAIDACLRQDIKLVTLVGKAGTGKTLLAIAAALQMVTEEQAYQKVVVGRPVMPLGRDIGFLPGDVEEKLKPWMQPIHDNVEYLLGLGHKRDKRRGQGTNDLVDMGVMEVEPLTYIRGRSLPHQFLIIDEAQNLTPHEVKTILTRAGDGTKVVL